MDAGVCLTEVKFEKFCVLGRYCIVLMLVPPTNKNIAVPETSLSAIGCRVSTQEVQTLVIVFQLQRYRLQKD